MNSYRNMSNKWLKENFVLLNMTLKDIQAEMSKRGISPSNEDRIAEIITASVCDFFEQDIHFVRTKTRKRESVWPRQMAIYLIRHAKAFFNTSKEYSLREIGAYFGGRDHSTVIHSFKTVQDQIDIKNKSVVHAIETLKEIISQKIDQYYETYKNQN